MKNNYQASILPQTVRNRVYKINCNGRVAETSNRYQRVLWAREHLSEPKELWNSILWPDESKFNIFGSDGPQTVWRQYHEVMKRECLKVTVK